MIILALTGSIGMGKSTTLRMFAEEGCAVWDADAAVHRLYQPGGAGAAAVSEMFGDVLAPDGAVDRVALGKIVLTDKPALARLEAAIHPLVAQDRQAFLDAATADVAVLDVPLLFETGGQGMADAVVLVTADEAVRRERVLARPGMTGDKLDAILARQMPEAARRELADYVIRTDEGLDAARAGVRCVLQRVRGTA